MLNEISYIRPYIRLVVGGGFEPPKASPTDLQSVPFGRSGTPPYYYCRIRLPRRVEPETVLQYGASEGTRTPGLLITNQLLYQLSYAGLTTLPLQII